MVDCDVGSLRCCHKLFQSTVSSAIVATPEEIQSTRSARVYPIPTAIVKKLGDYPKPNAS